MRKSIAITVLLVILIDLAFCRNSTPLNATDGVDVQIYPSTASQHEVHISINKTDPSNIIVSANTSLNQGLYYTTDGGNSWNGSDFMPNNSDAFCDPSTGFDAAGRGYVTTLKYSTENGYWVQFTDDEGLNWSNPISGISLQSINGPQDKEMMTCVDELSTSAYVNNFYCAWTDFSTTGFPIRINRSTNGGTSFSSSLVLSNHWGQGANVQTGPNGEVYVSWADYTNGSIPAQNIGFSRSTDGGISYSSSLAFGYLGVRTTNYENSLFGNTRVNDFPSMAIDKSCSTTRGRVYIAYPEFASVGSSQSVIRIRYSDDGGNTWSSPQTINIQSGRQNWFPWVAVDDLTGVVCVVYYSMDQSSGASTNTYLAYSLDGTSWDNIKVSDQSHIHGAIPGYARGYAGDYIGLCAYNGAAYAAWSDNRNNLWKVYVSKVVFNSATLLSSQDNLEVNGNLTIATQKNYQASNNIRVANTLPVSINSSGVVKMVAGQSVLLHDGFSALAGSSVIVSASNVNACTTPGVIPYSKSSSQNENSVVQTTADEGKVQIYPCPADDEITVRMRIASERDVQLSMFTIEGTLVGKYEPQLSFGNELIWHIGLQKIAPGTYYIRSVYNQNVSTCAFVKE